MILKRSMSYAIVLIMIFSGLPLYTQESGEANQDFGQISSSPNPTSGGTGGLADSPWPMFRGNVKHTGLSPYDTSGNNGELKWSFTTGGGVWSSPAIGPDGTIYVGSNDLHAINQDGTEKWSFITDDAVVSSPAISSDGTIYVGTCASDNKLFAINPDGTEKWRFQTGWTVASSPAIGSDGIIYVGSMDGNLYAINPDGTKKWHFLTSGYIDSSPAIGSDGTIYIGSGNWNLDRFDTRLYAINPDGIERWSYTTDNYRMQSSPAIGSDGTIYIGSHDYNLYAINSDGTKRWSFQTGGVVHSSPAISSDGTIYVGSFDDKLYAINPDGTEKWSFTTGSYVFSSPAIGSDGTIYVGSLDGNFYAINPDGTERWRLDTGGDIGSSPAIGSDGTIYVGSYDDNLYAIGNPTQPPVANAGSDQTVNEGEIVQFDGSTSYDPDGTIASYGWDFGDGSPIGTDVDPTHVYNNPADYTVTLTVTDNDGDTDSDTCIITVLSASQLPVANAGPDQTINEGDTVYFNGSCIYNTTSNWHKLDVNYATDSALHLRKTDPGGPYLGAWEGGVMEWVTFTSLNPFWIGKKASDLHPTAHLGQGPTGKEYTYYWKMHDTGDYTLKFRAGNGYFDADVYDETDGVYIVSGLYAYQGSTQVVRTLYEGHVYRVDIYDTHVLSGFPNDLDVLFELLETDILLTPNRDSLAYYITQSPLVLATEGPGVNSITFYSRAEQEFYAYYTSLLDHSEDVMSGGELSLAPDPYKTGISPGEYADIPLDSGGTGEVIYTWDFDASVDSDGDSNFTNDEDATGQTAMHVYGDNGIYTVTLTVTTESGLTDIDTMQVTVNNIAPSIIEFIIPYPVEEGIVSTFRATVKDFGSDDLTFEWDFGDMTSMITNTYYNDVSGPDPYPSPDGIYPFIAQDTLNHTYGDNYNYAITLKVTDDDGGATSFTTMIIVQNVIPTIEPFGPIIVDEGTPFDITAISTDQGSDDLTYTWEFELGPTITNTIYNDGGGPDPYPSPWGTYPFSASDSAGHTYGDDGNYSITLTVTDDDGGSSVYQTYVLVNNVPPSVISFNHTIVLVNEPRTIGYWGHQCGVEEPYGDHTGILQEWVDDIASQSQVFSWISTEEDVCGIVQEGDAKDMIVMAKRQLMGAWLNVVSGKLHPLSEIYMPNLTSSKTVWEAIQEIEDVILHSNNRTELERVKDLADNINNGIGIALAYVEFTATATDLGADDLTFDWDFGDGKSETHFYPNPNGTFPVEVTDHVGHSYFSLGTFTVTLTVSDDDGGVDVIVVIIVIV